MVESFFLVSEFHPEGAEIVLEPVEVDQVHERGHDEVKRDGEY